MRCIKEKKVIEISSTEVFGIGRAVYSARNAMNSWDRSDSKGDELGANDFDLAKRLVRAGTDHSKFMRMITVITDIKAPLYMLKELDTYKVGTVCNSTSTMHKIHAKKFTLDDFSHEHLENFWHDEDEIVYYNNEYGNTPQDILEFAIDALNQYRELFLKTKDKKYWWYMIQLLPSSYNQLRTYEFNYAVLRNIYHARKGHKLDEWSEFRAWIETLPCSEWITDGE